MPDIDVSGLAKKNTLILRSVTYKDGTTQDWVVPPFSDELEHSFWAWMQANDARRDATNEAMLRHEETKLATKGETWGPLLVLAVESPKLTLKTLLAQVDALALQDLGQMVQDFFLRRKLPVEDSPPPTPSPVLSIAPSPQTTSSDTAPA